MAKKAPTKKTASKRVDWLDDKSQTPLIDDYARELGTFLEALADGRVETHELQAQEERLVALMKEVEPRLDDELHALVTRLLCEISAYTIMQVLHEFQTVRSRTMLNL